MAFVNEEISAEDRTKYNIKKSADRWVVDRENGIFFVYTGSADYGRVLFFDLNLNGSVVKISTERLIANSTDPEKKAKNMDDLIYNIQEINIPEYLNMPYEKLKSLIEFTFKKSGRFGHEDGAASVTVNFPEKISIYQEKPSIGRII